jgi:hypothetical protein
MGLLRRLFLGSGRFPEDVRTTLVAEGPSVLEEGLAGSITYRHYRAPGTRSNWRKVGITGAIAVTDRRLVVWGGRDKQIDIPLGDERFAQLEISLDPPDRVLFACDAETFSDSRSGRVEIRLRCPRAAQVVEQLERPSIHR